jgi:hypothetical protein
MTRWEPSLSLVEWLAGGERGTSSNTIVEVLTGFPAARHGQCHPYDGADLRRCRLLLAYCPELLSHFPKMTSVSVQWRVLVEHWSELCRLMDEEMPAWRSIDGTRWFAPRLRHRMQSLLDGVEG